MVNEKKSIHVSHCFFNIFYGMGINFWLNEFSSPQSLANASESILRLKAQVG